MDTKRLLYFCTIVEQGQISRAARVLNISQPPLSQRLKELEDELGVQLIIREGHAWQVTEAGKALYERARQTLDQLAEIPAEVKNAADGFSGRISIGVSSTCLSHITEVLPDMYRKFPRLEFRLLVMDSSSLELQLRERHLDFAIVLLPLKYDIYRVQLLPADHFSIVLSNSLDAAPDKDPVGIRDLQNVPLLLSRRWDGGGSYEHLIKEFQKKGITPRVLLDSPNIDALLRTLETGLAVAAILPASQIPRSIRERSRICSLDIPELTIQPALIHLTDRYLTSAAQAVIEAILQRSMNEV